MKQWTQAQAAAIYSAGTNLLVSAGAGSGKTAVLTERIAQMVLQGGQIKQMLVVTFTNAAAGELKKRIQKRLTELACDPALTHDHRARATEQKDQFHLANISTMHAFCASLLRRHFHAAGIDPAFKILDDTQGILLRTESISEVLDTYYAGADADFLALDEGFGKKREGLGELVLWLYDFLHTRIDPWGSLQAYVNAYTLSPEQVCQSTQYTLACRQCGGALRNCVGELQAARTLFPPDAEYDKNRLHFDTLILSLRSAARAIEKQLPNSTALLQDFAFGRLTFPAKAQTAPPKDAIKTRWDRAKKAYAGCRFDLLDAQAQAELLRICLPQIAVLRAILLDFELVFTRKKTQKSFVDYADLEHMTLKALQNQTICDEYRARFCAIFLDEYQDTSAVQEAIVKKIAPPNGLFFVGDVKQSIYRFRAAEPALFTERAKAYARGEGGTLINLNYNFRSLPNVLHAVNDIFCVAMEQAGELTYAQEDRLISPKQDAHPLPCILDIIDTANRAESPDDTQDQGSEDAQDEETPDKTQCEALLAAKHIVARVGQPNGEDGKPICFGDFAILLRSTKNTAEVFAKTLASSGIPCYVELSGGYYRALEVQILLNLLRLTDNKRQDIALLSVLRMGLCGFSDADLVALREQFPKGSLHQALMLCANTPSPAGQSCRRVLAFLENAKRRCKLLPLEQFVAELMDSTFFVDFFSVLDGGEVRTANLEALLARIRQYEQSSSRGLNGFLTNIDRAFAAGKDMSEARVTTQGEDCVKIMSIHKSKGLEFPIVLVAGLGKLYNLRDAQKRLVASPTLGIGALCFDPQKRTFAQTLYHACIANALQGQTKAEELRMLYVAMTRAERELILIGSANLAKSDWVQGANKRSNLDYIMGALCKTRAAHEITGYFSGAYAQTDALWQINAISASTLSQKRNKQSTKRTVQALLEQVPEPSAIDFFAYEMRQVMTKVSVSDIDGSHANQLRIQKSPMFLQQERMSAADVGSATHLALMHINFKQSAHDELQEQLDSFVQKQIMTAQEAQAVNLSCIHRFLQTELGERMANSQLEREVPFLMQCTRKELGLGEDEQVLCLQGIIDACFVENNAYVAVDYKTDAILTTALETASHHFEQLRRYAIALARLSGKKVKQAYIVLLQTGECVQMPL